MSIEDSGVMPGSNNTFDFGTNLNRFATMYATTFNGDATGANTLKVNSNYRSGDTAATANTVAVRDASGNLVANEFTGVASSAKYADLAEKYTTSEELEVGTIVAVANKLEGAGGYEVEPATGDNIPVGVISEAPAYLMNADSEGQAVALKGRVPVKVTGLVNKGEAVYVDVSGVGSTVKNENGLVGIALESFEPEGDESGLVECILKV